ncbi:hypothetical protein BO78DRAFT_397409 [Aspergillus sclerotiicarbonarius CBS 121057]|uniref:C3H1-type domain-containing protein n=1 Tax=Aspergillus sclerotiicarbonarius (strain CBS 121057 / IBT 28362) TaxID=1448318 RepID=A0A319ERF0_ASPSB|nr:hypothetical protein BO78DRAFT_397409 [Aspergillus sclerotiicarbonarius CBS 121057]
MNPQGFSFPPPPPPPPSQQQQQQQQPQLQQQYHPNGTFPAQYGGQGYYGQRGGRAPGAHFRGRGRGYGNRGGARGGHFMTPDANRAYPAATPSVGYAQMNYAAYTTPQPLSTTPHSMSTTQVAPSTSPNFQRPANASSFTASQPFAQQAAHVPHYQGQPNYRGTYTPSPAQPGPGYPSAMPTHQHANQPVHTPMMGPPMRWGFEQTGLSGSFAGAQRSPQRGGRPFNGYNAQSPAGDKPPNYANKRDHSSAFGKPQSVAPRIPAPPPVPSFGNPLPSKPPPPADATRKPKKKKRKHNQLGLTPKTEEHESSEEEDDADEETRLATGAVGASASLQITYRGKTSTLQSPEDIAAWIEERRKRYPTQAKVEEKKKAMEEAKKARQEAQRQRDLRKQELKRAQKDGRNRKEHDKQTKEQPIDPMDAAAKAKQKADKLRRKLMKEEKRVAKAEADAERARIRAEELQKGSTDANIEKSLATPETQGQSTSESKTETGLDPENKPARPGSTVTEGSEINNGDTTPATDIKSDTGKPKESREGDGLSVPSSDVSDSSDWTSSSGSDSSSDDSDSDDDSAPEEASSRREGPDRVAPPARDSKRKVCKHFARNGRCARGQNCRFLHEAPERGSKAKPTEPQGRKGLLQALLERQKGEENRKVMEAIAWLGENGFLDGPKDPGGANDQTLVTEGVEATPHAAKEQQAAPEATPSGQEADAAVVTA